MSSFPLVNGLPYWPNPLTGPLNILGNFSATGTGSFGGNLSITGNIIPTISLHASNGSAANPSIAFLNSQNTGLYRYAAASIGFSAAGTSIGYWNSTTLNLTGNLTVNGGSGNYFEAPNLNPPSLGSTGGTMRMLYQSLYGLLSGVSGSGAAWLQVQRTDGVATAYPLALNPTGGNVLIGTLVSNGAKCEIYKSNGGNSNGAANAALYLPLDESTIQGPGAWTQIRMGGNLVLGGTSTLFLQIGGTSVAYASTGVFALWSGNALRLGHNYTAGVVASTGYVTIQDATGTTYKVLCAL